MITTLTTIAILMTNYSYNNNTNNNRQQGALSCFQKTEWFHECTHTEPCRGYGNGKSMVRVDSPHAECFGVHYFKGKGHDVPPSEARILHFESCDYDTWKRKFTTPIPSQFPFYRYSHDAIRQCSSSTGSSDDCEKVLHRAYTSLTNLESQPSRFHLPISSLLFHPK